MAKATDLIHVNMYYHHGEPPAGKTDSPAAHSTVPVAQNAGVGVLFKIPEHETLFDESDFDVEQAGRPI